MTTEQPPDPTTLHHALVDDLVARELVTSPAVEAAFRAVRREHFLPDHPPEEVYADRAIATKVDERGRAISSSSQPAIMAIMLEQLDLQPGHNVLEIGAGTGYNAALIAHIVGEHGRVTTIDIDDDLAAAAQAHLAAAGCDHVHVICGDGMHGYAPHAPYDRIILTVAGWDIPPEWLAHLKPEGHLVLPLSFYGPQLSIAFARQDGHLASKSIRACGFMPMRGPRSEPVHKIQISERWEVTIVAGSEGQARATDPATLEAWLGAPFVEETAEIELSRGELLFKWPLWAALYEPGHVVLHVYGNALGDDAVVDLFPPWGMSMGLLAGSGLALLATPADAGPAEGENDFAQTLHLQIRSYGPDKTVAAQLRRRLQAWDSAGRPPHAERMAVWALPATASPTALAADVHLTRRWHHFGIRWEAAGS